MALPREVSNAFVAKQLALVYVLILLAGAIASAPVFTVAIADAAHPRGALDHMWPLGLSLAGAASALLMVPTAALFHASSSQTATARMLTRVAAACFLLILFGAAGVALSNRVLVFLGGLVVSPPIALISSFSMQHVAELVPGRFGAAVGFSSVVIGVGLVLMTWLDHAMLRGTGSATLSLCMFSGILSLSMFLPSLGLTFRAQAGGEAGDAVSGDASERAPLLAEGEQKSEGEDAEKTPIALRDALRSGSVWLFVLIVGCKRITYAVVPYFFDIGQMYGASSDTLVAWFQAGSVLSTGYNLLLSFASDSLHTRSGPLRSGGRNVMVFTLLLQVFACAALVVAPPTERMFVVWAAATTAMRMTSQAHFSMAILIAKDFFGTQNMSLMAGSANGTAIGVGVLFSSGVMAFVIGGDGNGRDLQRLEPYYRIALAMSVISLVLLGFLRKQPKF